MFAGSPAFAVLLPLEFRYENVDIFSKYPRKVNIVPSRAEQLLGCKNLICRASNSDRV